MLANRALKRDPETGRLYPEDIPWEVCQCGYLPHEDRDCCTVHGTNAKHRPEPEPQPAPQPKRISIGRTRQLYDIAAASSALAKIEEIVQRADMEGEFMVEQSSIMRWAIRKCGEIAEDVRISEDELL